MHEPNAGDKDHDTEMKEQGDRNSPSEPAASQVRPTADSEGSDLYRIGLRCHTELFWLSHSAEIVPLKLS
jgi:hypothetical protein